MTEEGYMEKIDLYKELKHLYLPSSKEVDMVDVPAMNFLMVDGMGDPNTSQSYMEAMNALYGVSYTLKFALKQSALAIDYRVRTLEGWLWTEESTKGRENRNQGKGTERRRQKNGGRRERGEAARAEGKRKKKPPARGRGRCGTVHEGLCAQIMHIGPFSKEGPAIEKVHQFIREHGRLVGKHHEIYMSDVRRVDPAKWKTVIRQPMQLTR